MKQLLILSGKGGTGKTTLAGAFIRLSAADSYADCDVDAPNLHLVAQQSAEPLKTDFYGLQKAEIDHDKCILCDICRQSCRFDAISKNGCYEVNAFACEGCGVCEAICPTGAIALRPDVAGELMLYTGGGRAFSTAQLKMGSGTSGLLVTEVKKQLKSAAGTARLAIIDGSPGIGCPVIASLSGVDMVLIVAEPSLSGIHDMERIIITAAKFAVKTGVCVNKYDTNLKITEEIRQFCLKQGLPFLGLIPYDDMAVSAINMGKSIVDIACPSGEAARDVFDNTMEILFAEQEKIP